MEQNFISNGLHILINLSISAYLDFSCSVTSNDYSECAWDLEK